MAQRTQPSSPIKQEAATAEGVDDSDPTYSHFGHRTDFLAILDEFLAVNAQATPSPAENDAEDEVVKKMGAILDFYLPMPGLLDPALGDIVPPLMAALGKQLALLADGREPNQTRFARIGRVINWVVKVRGWKSVVPYFPSTLPHLSNLISVLSPPSDRSGLLHHSLVASDGSWELRAVLLLWLALLLTVPFSLSALDTEDIPTNLDIPTHERLFSVPAPPLAVRVTLLSLPLLSNPGKDGEYGALILARLFAREDALAGLPGFLKWAAAALEEGEREQEANLVASLFSFLAVLPGMAPQKELPILRTFFEESLIPHLAGSTTSATSGLIRKLATKANGRWWVACLGAGLRDQPDADLPEGIEEVLDDLMSALGDKDTIVRYSAAKYLARIAALLPSELSEQIVSAVIGLFAGSEDDPVILTKFGTVIDPGGSAGGNGTMGLGGQETSRGEARWHGVCLAVAELSRRGLLPAEAVDEVIPWVVKALTFDLRRASHSIGSNVRDAASYVLWSLSRAASPQQLKPFAELMATTLASVAVFDREVGVRRAASAAFQEGVGRSGLYPEGIDILGKIDFYSVSIRRKAFTEAAPGAARHTVYRKAFREHLHNITLRHWDGAMRSAGATALAALLELDPTDIPDSIRRELAQVSSFDSASAHGALLALAQIAPMLGDDEKAGLFEALTKVRPGALVTSNAADIVNGGCQLAAAALTPAADLTPIERFFSAATQRRETDVHESLATLCRRMSIVQPDSTTLYERRTIGELTAARASTRQAAALCLGSYQYRTPIEASGPLDALLAQFGKDAKADVETRRNAVQSLAQISVQQVDGVPLIRAMEYERILHTLTAALDDYTTDQRGDVGSWVRTASVRSIAQVIAGAAPQSNALQLVPQELFAPALAGTAKQAFEKLDVVREAATVAWGELLGVSADRVWDWPGAGAMAAPGDEHRVRPSAEWFTAGLDLLCTPMRPAVVAGLVQSAGAVVHSTSERCLRPLVPWLQSHESERGQVVADVVDVLGAHLASNRIAVPALTTLSRLMEAGIEPSAAEAGRMLGLAARGLTTLKSIERLIAAMRVVMAVYALRYTDVSRRAAGFIGSLLSHRFPRIRALTAETLYLAVGDEAELELEEMLLETPWAEDGDKATAGRAVALLREMTSEFGA